MGQIPRSTERILVKNITQSEFNLQQWFLRLHNKISVTLLLANLGRFLMSILVIFTYRSIWKSVGKIT